MTITLRMKRVCWIVAGIAAACASGVADAQRVDENAIISAGDAFGTTVGNESIGLYSADSIRGFSPTTANNVRIEGLYFDQQSPLTDRVSSGSDIRIGLAAQGFPLPAPTGIVDLRLRSAGSTPLLSVVAAYGPFGGSSIELDGQLPLGASQAATAIGAARYKFEFANGTGATASSVGLVPRWRPTENIEVLAFWGMRSIEGNVNPPVYVLGSASPVPRLDREVYPGPAWSTSDIRGQSAGMMMAATLGNWVLRLGEFYSSSLPQHNSVVLLSDVLGSGEAKETIIVDPAARYASRSGEIRVAHSEESGDIDRRFIATFRHRQVDSRYGGSDYIDAGVVNVHESGSLLARPSSFDFTAQDRDQTTQATVGFSYEIAWKQLAQLGFGVQKSDYTQQANPAFAPSSSVKTRPWMPSILASYYPRRDITIYGSFTRGLEDAGIAPDVAVNRLKPLPAITTTQWDLGLQWKQTDNATLLLGLFDISKPYLSLGADAVYSAIGNERHTGVELSQTLKLDGVTLVAGAVLSNPRVTADGTDLGAIIGRRPIGQPSRILQLSANYEISGVKGLSFDTSVSYSSKQAGLVDNSIFVPSATLISVGSRYKFMIGNRSAAARLSVGNLTNRYAVRVLSSGSYQPIDPRSLYASLTIDM